MNNDTVQRLKDLISNTQSVGISVGKNPNLDEMGAALGLYLSLKSMGKQLTIASPTNPLVEISSLVGINKVKKSLESDGGDLVVSFPYREGEIEKVSYTLEDGFLNIIVKAGELGLSFDEKSVEYKRSGGVPALLFIVGTPRLSDLGAIFNPEALKNTTIVNIDNKSDNQGFGDIVLVSQKFSSVSEQVAHLLYSLGFQLDLDTAQNLLAGISFATNNFQKPGTSIVAFEMAALLMKKGAIRERNTQQKNTIADGYGNKHQGPQQQPSQQQRQSQPVMDMRGNGQQQRPFNRSQFGPQQQQQRQPFVPQQQQPQISPTQPQPVMQHSPQQPQQQPHQVQPQRAPMAITQQDMQGTQEAKESSVPQSNEAPPDWLTPKIYKGSTVV